MTFVVEKELLLSEEGVQKGNDPAILYAWEHVPISLYPPSRTLFTATTLGLTARHFRLSPSPSC